MAERYLKRNLATGKMESQEALVESAGAGDAGKIPALDAAGKLAASLMPSGVGAEVVTAAASEEIGAGKFVNLWWDAGTRKMRLADANNDRPAHGYVRDAVANAATGSVYPLGTINDDLSGLTAGTVYFLSATAGGVTDDVSGYADGDIIQRLGVAIATTSILTEWNEPSYLADA